MKRTNNTPRVVTVAVSDTQRLFWNGEVFGLSSKMDGKWRHQGLHLDCRAGDVSPLFLPLVRLFIKLGRTGADFFPRWSF